MSLEEIHRAVSGYRRLADWRTGLDAAEGAKNLEFDDSSWQVCSPGWSWDRGEGDRWFRKTIEIPDSIHGVTVEGSRIMARLFCLAETELFIDGRYVDSGRYWFDGSFPVTESATPGEMHIIAMRSPRAEGLGHFNFSELHIERLDDLLLELGTISSRSRLIRDLVELGRLDGRSRAAVLASSPPEIEFGEKIDLGAAMPPAREYGAGVAKTEAGLEDLTTYLVGHAHIDMNWLWDHQDTVETCRRTFASVDRLMDESPELIFSQSQAAVYSIVEESHPELFERIRERVREGRWDITASTWVEGDLNMASGESLVRQTTTALRYIEDRFGVTPGIAWCPDTFGHPATYPQVLKGCGIPYYYAHRCTRGDAEHLFWWEAPDGSRVLVFNEGVTYNNTIGPHLLMSFPKMLDHYGLPAHMAVFGVGDHGGGPTRRDLRNSRFLNGQRAFPKFRHSRAQDFFDLAKGSEGIPVVREELNFVFEGCYTTHGDIKKMNRRGEVMLFEAEVMATLAGDLGYDYPAEDLRRAWCHVLFNQFHDLLDGSAIGVAYEHSARTFAEARDLCARISRDAMGILIGEGGSSHLAVFNCLPWQRKELVRLSIPEGFGPGIALRNTESGLTVPHQIVGSELLIAGELPPTGYSSYALVPGKDEAGSDPKAPRAVPPSRPGQPFVLENQFFRLSVSPTSSTISSIYDKRLGRELLSPADPANLFQVCYEKPHGMSAWSIGPISREENLLDGGTTRVSHAGSVHAAVEVSLAFGSSKIVQMICIHRDIPRIDFETRVDWREVGGPHVDSPMLKVAFPFAHSAARCIREVPFGTTSYPTDGREVPSLTFLELPGDGFGISLLNDCKYGHDARGNRVRLTLLRAAYDPDPRPDIGTHEIRYFLYPHGGDWMGAEVWKRGREVNSGIHVRSCGPAGAGKSFLQIDEEGVDLACLKAADDGRGAVLRLVEMHGRSVDAALRIAWKAKTARRCDMRERQMGGESRIRDGRVVLHLGPHEIGTWRIE